MNNEPPSPLSLPAVAAAEAVLAVEPPEAGTINTVISLDAGALARLRELDPDGRHGVVMRVMKAFESSLSRMMGQLSAQLVEPGRGDPAVLARVAHTLKSSSASVGAMSLARACAEVEQGVRSGTLSDIDVQVRRLVAECEAALAAVTAMLRQ
ncbi:MAG TPA: Hpt domain-containing protein [Rubrivivax sp.]|jgi:HPt (histidine-containing phosphotransfer) domain-containing protein|nr:Hpt domain-containing protein [Rubrivivax sp.]